MGNSKNPPRFPMDARGWAAPERTGGPIGGGPIAEVKLNFRKGSAWRSSRLGQPPDRSPEWTL